MDNQTSKSQNAGEDSSELLESSKTHVKKTADDLVAAGTAKVQELKDATAQQGQQYVDAVQDRVKGWQENAESFARDNPLRAMVTALGVGFVLGILFRR